MTDRKELRVGDRVWVALRGAEGYATVMELRPTVAILKYDAGHRAIHHWDRKAVLYRHLQKEEA